MKRQGLLERRADFFRQRERNAGTGSHAASLQLQSNFEKKKFFKDQAAVRRRGEVLQSGKSLAFGREVRLLKGGAAIHQIKAAADRRWKSVGDFRRQILQRAMDDAAKPARRELGVGGGLIDGNDPAYLEGFDLLSAFKIKLAL